MSDWYRRTTWTKIDEEEFFKKLNRAWKDSRAQYLRIQASYLIETKLKKNLNAAEKLLNLILTEYPEERFDLSMIYLELGEIHYHRKDYEKALEFYKKSMDHEKVFPNLITTSYLNYSKTVVLLRKFKKYDEVYELLINKIKIDTIKFPYIEYITYSILSIISKHNGDLENAQIFRNLAEQNALAETNLLWNPKKKKYGIVKNRISWLDKMVKE